MEMLRILQELLADQFDVDPDEITPNTDLYDDLNADSLDLVELAMACEEEFDVEITDCDENWAVSTVGDVMDRLRELGVK